MAITHPRVVAFRLQLGDLLFALEQMFARAIQFLGERRKFLQAEKKKQ